MNRTVLKAVLPLMLVAFVGSAYAQKPPPEPKGICHNIGGPDALGANCDQDSGICIVLLEDGGTVSVVPPQFLGIIVGTDSAGALAAHIAHGDGPILMSFDPPLHLASTDQNHKASNVECLGTRLIDQPPDPGN